MTTVPPEQYAAGQDQALAAFTEYLRAVRIVRAHQGRPRFVTLCGSTRRWDALLDEARTQGLTGRIVLMPIPGIDPADAPALKAELAELHRAKIAFADEVIVVAPGGYVGESTRAEIEFAESLGLPVTYSPPLDGEPRLRCTEPAAAEPQAYLSRQQFRVEVHEAPDVDVPDGGWSPVTSSMRTLDEAVERMRARRGRCPDGPAMRVVREWTTHTVAASEEPTP